MIFFSTDWSHISRKIPSFLHPEAYTSNFCSLLRADQDMFLFDFHYKFLVELYMFTYSFIDINLKSWNWFWKKIAYWSVYVKACTNESLNIISYFNSYMYTGNWYPKSLNLTIFFWTKWNYNKGTAFTISYSRYMYLI